MFGAGGKNSAMTEVRLAALYDADGLGGGRTMRAKVIRELMMRSECYGASLPRPKPGRPAPKPDVNSPAEPAQAVG